MPAESERSTSPSPRSHAALAEQLPGAIHGAMTRRIVLTWLTTAEGGAERSTLELAHGLKRLMGIDVVILWWSYDADSNAPTTRLGVRLHHVTNMAAYVSALTAELARDPRSTVLIGTHRTALVDVQIAR